MALTGIEIFKKLPKTNCGECGVPTCLAFAMKLAAGQAELAACPYVSAEAKAALEEASAPPIRPVTIGSGDKALKIGGETVMFRHEKRFVSPTGIAVLVSDQMNEAEVDRRLKNLHELKFDRVGLTLQADLVALKGESGDPARFETLVNKVKAKLDGKGMVLMSEDSKVLTAGARACAECKPLLYAATNANADAMAGLAKEISAPLAVKARYPLRESRVEVREGSRKGQYECHLYLQPHYQFDAVEVKLTLSADLARVQGARGGGR